MRSAKDLQDAAAKERAKAQAERDDAQKHRNNANSMTMDTDPQIAFKETEQAQAAEERAQVHDKAANDFIQEASVLEAKAVEAERKKQTRQVEVQRELDKLDEEAKRLRGE